MTTPERGLFERIEPFLEPLHPNSAWHNRIKAEIEKFEQRLAEAENYISRLPADWDKNSSLETWFPFTAEKIKRDEEAIAQLRARCGELEKLLAPLAREAVWWDDVPGVTTHETVELWQNPSRRTNITVGDLRRARAAITAAPQPAQEQKGAESLLRTYDSPLPEGCYCEPGKCMAPRIMGVQQACRDPQKAKQEQTTK